MGKFRIKISSSWFSDDFIILKYSTNGLFWKKIYQYEYDSLDNWCYMVIKTEHYKNAEYLLSKFKSIDDIIKYEEEERKKGVEHNNQISKRNKKLKEDKQKIYQKFG